jgi:hypothetical protein
MREKAKIDRAKVRGEKTTTRKTGIGRERKE